MLREDGDATTFYAGSADVELYRSETAHYRDNLATGAPSLWVVLRPTEAEPPYELIAVTADPAEGEAFTEAGADLVEHGADAGADRARSLRPSSPSTMSSGSSSSASATAPIPRRWRGAARRRADE